MKKIVRSCVPNVGTAKDKKTGQPFSWDKMYVFVEVEDDNPKSAKPLFGHAYECLNVNSSFDSVVITNGFPVSKWEDLKNCMIDVFYNQWRQPTSIRVLAINADF